MRLFPRAAWAWVTLVAAACGGLGSDLPKGEDTSGCFVAYGAQFTGFRGWASHHMDGPALGGDTHAAGPRTEYLSAAPPSGASEFPFGTILVKEIETTDPATHHVFAMVKRGCGFNADGTRGWEWFELSLGGGAKETILWRGTAPPDSVTFGASTSATCNGCHASCAGNDFVCSKTFTLRGSSARDASLGD